MTVQDRDKLLPADLSLIVNIDINGDQKQFHQKSLHAIECKMRSALLQVQTGPTSFDISACVFEARATPQPASS